MPPSSLLASLTLRKTRIIKQAQSKVCYAFACKFDVNFKQGKIDIPKKGNKKAALDGFQAWKNAGTGASRALLERVNLFD